MGEVPGLDPIIHAPVRLAVMSALLPVASCSFATLKDRTGASDGNLASHLSRLEGAGYIEVHKQFVDRRPRTTYTLTDAGRAAFSRYLDALEALLPDR